MKMGINGLIGAAPPAGMIELPAGRGVFETLLLRGEDPMFFDDHWTRFVAGCQWYDLGRPATPEQVIRLAAVVAQKNSVRTGVLRFAAWQGDRRVEWRVEVTPPRPHLTRSDFRVGIGPAVPAEAGGKPLAAVVSAAGSPDLREFKHLNRQLWHESLRAARTAGWDEAVLCDEAGRLLEGCVSNLFFVRAGRLCTPAVKLGPLPGIMRQRVLALARGMRDLAVEEGSYTRVDLEQAEEIWLSNSLIGLRNVTSLAGRSLGNTPPVLQRLRTEWRGKYGWDPVVVAGL